MSYTSLIIKRFIVCSPGVKLDELTGGYSNFMSNQLAFKNITGNEVNALMYGSRPYSLSQNIQTLPTKATPITIRYRPESKFLEVVWNQPVTSEAYRQSIRFIGLCIVVLRAEYMIQDFSKVGIPSEEDMQHTAAFLQKALQKTTLVRSARVLSDTASQQQAHETVVKHSPELPYEVRAFHSIAEAKEWLFQHPYKRRMQPEASLHIPLQCSIKELKKLAVAQTPNQVVHTGYKSTEPSTITHCKTEFAELVIDKQIGLLKLNWFRRVSSREYRYTILKAGRAILEHKLTSLLMQNQRVGTLTLEDQTWVVTTSVNLLTNSKLKFIAIVSSSDVMQQMASESMKDRILKTDLPFCFKYFFSETDALSWLQTPEIE